MTRISAAILLCALLAGCAGVPRLGPGGSGSVDRSYDRQILLTVPEPVRAGAALSGEPNRRYLRRRGYGAPPAIDRTLDELAREHGLERLDGWSITSLGVYCEVFEVPENVELQNVIDLLMNDPRVDLVQRMNVFETLSSHYDDPYADLQTAVSQLGIEEAHQLATGKGVTVAVIDSAIDASHPDLRGHIYRRHDLTAADVSGGGEVHGTAVAGVIASTANNNEGIVGVAPDVRIAALRACWSVDPARSAARCSSFSLAQALELALSIAPAAINLSLGGPSDPLLARLLREALRRGIVVVAAGAAVGREELFPASYPGVIVAHALQPSQSPTSRYELSAPGTEILTTVPGAGYAFLSGNSLAAAYVSGVIALLAERDSSIDSEAIATLLTETTADSAAGSSISACGALERLTKIQICARRVNVAQEVVTGH